MMGDQPGATLHSTSCVMRTAHMLLSVLTSTKEAELLAELAILLPPGPLVSQIPHQKGICGQLT